jgi:shikimate dehydrogenase
MGMPRGVVGLIGRPVHQAMSPTMQNAAFQATGLDWTYLAFDVAPAAVREAIDGMRALGFAGANVTRPHKVAAACACHELDAIAVRCGSVNVLRFEKGIETKGFNTDCAGFGRAPLRGAQVIILGAGGVARSAVAAVQEMGAAGVAVASRRTSAASRMVDELGERGLTCHVEVLTTWPPKVSDFDVVINATAERDDPLVPLCGRQTVVDFPYHADGHPTALADRARRLGCAVLDGLTLLLEQGAAAFEIWTGSPAPIDAMRQALGTIR